MKNTANISLALCTLLIVYIVADKFTTANTSKTGIVQMEKLVYDFKGMKEATASYTHKMKQWSAQSDSLENKLKELYRQIRLDSLSNNKAKLESDTRRFMTFKQSYTGYVNNMRDNADKEDRQMTLGVVNQVNEYIKAYARQEGYDLILCNSQQQSIGYAKAQTDITQKVLEFANNKYEGSEAD